MHKRYTTISGDMWDKIAHEQMGSPLYADRLIKANARHASLFVLPAGITLDIPDVECKEDAGLPPWKRGILD